MIWNILHHTRRKSIVKPLFVYKAIVLYIKGDGNLVYILNLEQVYNVLLYS